MLNPLLHRDMLSPSYFLIFLSVQKYSFDFVCAVVVGHVFEVGDFFGDEEVGCFAFGYGAVGVAYAHCVGGVEGGGIDGFLWGHAVVYAGERDYGLHVATW